MGVHSDGLGAFDVDCPVVDEQSVPGSEAEAIEGKIVDGGIGLEQLFLALNDYVAKAAEEGLLLFVEGRPEIGGKIGDREERHAGLVELAHDLVHPGDGIADRLAEPLAPGGDQVGIFGEFLRQLGRGVSIGTASIEGLVPVPQADIVDEFQPRRIVRDLPDEEGIGIPAVKDVADVEDDGRRCFDTMSRSPFPPGTAANIRGMFTTAHFAKLSPYSG